MNQLYLVIALISISILCHLSQPTNGQLTFASSCASSVPADGSIPNTWNVRSIHLIVGDANATVLADDSKSSTIVVNGTSPGPRIDVDEFDWVVVTITSELASSTSITAIHWHGMNLYGTPYSAGVAGISQCGQHQNTSVTFSFCAYPAGTHYYHGMNNLQSMSGLYGAFIVYPKNLTANSTTGDINAKPTYAQDLVWMAADTYVYNINNTLSPLNVNIPTPQSVIVNGVLSNTSVLNIIPGTSVLRLINSGSLRSYVFSIDGVVMTVIGLDGTAIQPYRVREVRLSVGQRASVTVDFSPMTNASSIIYRVRAITSSSLVVTNGSLANEWVGFIVINSTSSQPTANPPTSPSSAGTFSDINALQARPLTYSAIGREYYGRPSQAVPQPTTSLTLNIISEQRNGVTRLVINNASFDTSAVNSLTASKTTLPLLYTQIRDISAGLVPNVTQSLSAVIPSSEIGQYALSEEAVVNILILNADLVQHSFHMHGHSFWIVATSDNLMAEHNREFFMVRDTVGIPGSGWALLRFVSANPGAWLLSSASDWYFSQGVAVIFLEATYALTPNYLSLPPEQLRLCNESVQDVIAEAIEIWHDVNDPVTYDDTALSQGSRAVIGGVVGGVCGVILLIIILCTVFGIHKDDASAKSKTAEPEV